MGNNDTFVAHVRDTYIKKKRNFSEQKMDYGKRKKIQGSCNLPAEKKATSVAVIIQS